MDNAYREQTQWFGEISHLVLGSLAGMGDTPLIRKYLRDFGRSQRPDGITRSCWPAHDVGIWSHHALYTGLVLREYFRFTGRQPFVEELYPVLQGILRWYGNHADSGGLVGELENHWLDWSSTDLRGVNFMTNALYLTNLEAAAEFAGVLGRTGEQREYLRKADRIRRFLEERFWSEEHGAYFDALVEGKPTGRFSEHTNAFALHFGLAPRARRERIQDMLVSERPERARMSPGLFHWLAAALMKTGRAEDALELLRRRFAGMHNQGSEGVWEEWSYNASVLPIRATPGFRPAGRFPEDYWSPKDRSLAQGSSVGNSYVLSTEILGVKPAEPGFRRVLIAPDPGGLKWARGALPVPQGLITVGWSHGPGSFEINCRLPAGLKGQLVFPFDRSELIAVRKNGRRLTTGELHIDNERVSLNLEDESANVILQLRD
jgi:hypothetical protein